MVSCKVSYGSKVSLKGHCEAIQSRDVAFVELEILLQEKLSVLQHSQINLFLFVEHGIYPAAMVHVHWLNKVRFDNIAVNLGCLSHNMDSLLGVLANNSVRCRVDKVTLDFRHLLRHIEPELAPLTIVEVLLGAHRLLATLVCLLSIWALCEDLLHGVFRELGFVENHDYLVVSGISLKLAEKPDLANLRVVVENACQYELSHVKVLCVHAVLGCNQVLAPFIAFLLKCCNLSLDQCKLLSD